MTTVVRAGAVAYDPKIVTIWEGMREYFSEQGLPTDYVLFSNYEAQVEALFDGFIDIAWNTNLAYLRCEQRAEGDCQVLGMRDADIDFRTRLIARRDAGISGWSDLRGKRLAVGSADSVQAAIVPLHFLGESGLVEGRDVEVVRFNTDVGKHGDTGTSELEVLQALHDGDVQAGAIGHATWLQQLAQGRIDAGVVQSVWESPGYSHCNFTALPTLERDLAASWSDALLRMDRSDPRWRRLMELEGLTRWLPGDKDGYRILHGMVAGQASRRSS